MNKLLLAVFAAGVLAAVYFAVLPNTGQLTSGDGVGASGKIRYAFANAGGLARAISEWRFHIAWPFGGKR